MKFRGMCSCIFQLRRFEILEISSRLIGRNGAMNKCTCFLVLWVFIGTLWSKKGSSCKVVFEAIISAFQWHGVSYEKSNFTVILAEQVKIL